MIIPLTKIPARSQYTGKITVELKDSPQTFDVVFSTVARDNILLFKHKFDHTGLPSVYTAPGYNGFQVNAFGGKGSGGNYCSATKIGQVDLGKTIVGVLEKFEGFGDEIGDGCVMISFSRSLSFENSSQCCAPGPGKLWIQIYHFHLAKTHGAISGATTYHGFRFS